MSIITTLAAALGVTPKRGAMVETPPLSHPIETYSPYWTGDDSYAMPTVDDLVAEKGLTVYREMEDRDDQVAACLGVMRSARLSSGWTLTAASDDPKDQEIRDFIAYDLQHMERYSVEMFMRDIMDGIGMGFACLERVRLPPYQYGPWKGKQGLRCYIPLPQETVTVHRTAGVLDPDGIWQSKNKQLVVASQAPDAFDRYDASRFILWSWRRKWASPLGQSILRPAYRWYFQKDQWVKWWARFLEYHGGPWVVVEVPTGVTETERQAILERVRTFQHQQRMTIKTGTKVQLIEASTAPTDAYRSAIQECNKGIGRTIHTPALLFDNEGSTGSLALGTAQKGTYEWTQEDLGADLRTAAMAPLLRAEVDHNFGPEYETPIWNWKPFREPEREVVGRLLDLMIQWGVPVSESMVYTALNFEPPKNGENLLKALQRPMDPSQTPLQPGTEPEDVFGPKMQEWMREYHRAATQGGTDDDMAEAVAKGAGKGDRQELEE